MLRRAQQFVRRASGRLLKAAIIAAERRDVYSYAAALIISANSEMLSISLFAEEEIMAVRFL